jgi:ABC-2 type transport system ATP-binding protein
MANSIETLMAPAIHTEALSKSFETINAVDRLNLVVHEGEMFGLVGPDGAGKTTTIRMLCGILSPSSGGATVLGYDVLREPDLVKSHLGYLSQRFTLYGDLSVDENIEFFAEINGVHDFKKERDELLEFTRLTPFRTRLAERLSGGMKQKLALACTLIHTPKILFLDEPTTGVDPVSRRDFWRILQSLLQRGITIVMTTPYMDEAERCSRVGLMSKGRLMTVDAPDEIKRTMPGEVVEIVCEDVRGAFDALKGKAVLQDVQAFGDRLNAVVKNAAKDMREVNLLLKKAGIAMTSWRVISPSLENVFIYLLTHNQSPEDNP